MKHPDQRLYDYTSALAAGVALCEGAIKTILPSLYLENNKIYGEDVVPLVYEGEYPDRLPQAYEDAINRIGAAFGVPRSPNEKDDAYRQKVKLRIIQSPTKEGIERSVRLVFEGLGIQSRVFVYPGVENFFDAVTSSFEDPFRGKLGARMFRVTVHIYPGFRESVPQYIDTVFAGSTYRIKRPGIYKLTFDPFSDYGDSNHVLLYTENSQFPITSRRLVLSSERLVPGTTLDLGFMSPVQSLDLQLPDSSPNLYSAKLEYDEKRFDFYRNPAYNGLLSAFGVDFLKEVFSGILAFGIEMEKIVVRQ